MDPSLISAGIQAGAGIAQSVEGIVQMARAKKMAASNPRPKYYIPSSEMDNQRLSESRAGQGMSDAARNTFSQESQRGLTGGIEAILKGGGSVNNIADIYGSYQSGVAKMSIIDDEMRSQNIKNMIAQNSEMAGYKDKEWQVNVFAPYADKAQAAAQLQKQGSDNLWKGINSIGSAATNYGTSQQYKGEADRTFGENQRVDNAYIDNLNRPQQPMQNNTTIVPIQQNQQFAQVFPTGPQFNPGNLVGGQYNWMYGNQQQTPVVRQQPSIYQTVAAKYPGLMYGGWSPNQ